MDGPGWVSMFQSYGRRCLRSAARAVSPLISELDTLEAKPERARKRMCERGLANAWHVLDQQVPARQHAGHREAQLAILAKDDLAGRFDHAMDR